MSVFQIFVNNQLIGVIDTAGGSQPTSAAQQPSLDPSAVPPATQAGAAYSSAIAAGTIIGGGGGFISNPS